MSASVATMSVASLIIHMDPSQRADHSKSLSGRSLRLPGSDRAHLPFPPAAVWEWRRLWAPLKSEDELARAMGKLGISGPCDACKNTKRNKQCGRRMCLACCQDCAATGGEGECKLKEHKPGATGSNSTPKSVSPAIK